MSREQLRIRRELRLALEQWLLNGYLPVAHIVAEPDLSDDVVSLQAWRERSATSRAVRDRGRERRVRIASNVISLRAGGSRAKP